MDTVTPEGRGFGLEFLVAVNTAQAGRLASEGEHGCGGGRVPVSLLI
jgi:hypothetical protein